MKTCDKDNPDMTESPASDTDNVSWWIRPRHIYVTEGAKDGEEYLLSIAFVFKHPNVITGKIDRPKLTLPYTIRGPENFQYRHKGGGEPYHELKIRVKKPGLYSFRFDNLKLEKRPITQEALDEYLKEQLTNDRIDLLTCEGESTRKQGA